jgi:NTE family protein
MVASTPDATRRRDAEFYPSPSLPAGHRYQRVALVLQGGGALGAYQAGVYQGLAEAQLHPNWVAGISIGALNAAIIAGNPPQQRVERLQEFWQTICRPPLWPPSPLSQMDLQGWPTPLIRLFNGWEAWRALTEGQNGFFLPRVRGALDHSAGLDTLSYYDTAPLKATLEALVDFDRLNDSREMRISVGAVNVETGNFVYFDNTNERLCAEHFMASGALPPGLPAVEIDGACYWDGGVVSNTPLQKVLATTPRRNSLVFQVDLWSAHGARPTDLSEVVSRQKAIQYSSRTRMITTYMKNLQQQRRLLRELMKLVPEEARQHNPWYQRAADEACDRLFNVFHLIYQNTPYEGYDTDFQFGARTMREHWQAGLADIRRSLQHRGWLDMPTAEEPFLTHDVHRP